MHFGIIGKGAIGRYVHSELLQRGHTVGAVLQRSERPPENGEGGSGIRHVTRVEDLPNDIEHVIDCAGHAALRAHGPAILRLGMDLTTVSIGALADDDLYRSLEEAARDGNTRLHLVSGAIGALDCLRSARIGHLDRVTYTGRKPPRSWKGSPAESRIDLDNLGGAAVHFEGPARIAAREYPQNANVAAAVALSGVGFDETMVKLIADPNIEENIHEVEAIGEFGRMSFEIRGRSLPDNPRSSALAAMSVIATIEQQAQKFVF